MFHHRRKYTNIAEAPFSTCAACSNTYAPVSVLGAVIGDPMRSEERPGGLVARGVHDGVYTLDARAIRKLDHAQTIARGFRLADVRRVELDISLRIEKKANISGKTKIRRRGWEGLVRIRGTITILWRSCSSKNRQRFTDA